MTLSATGKIRTLVVDDSTSMRMLIRSILAADPAIEVVGTAIDGVEAVERAMVLKPDIITMDVEMPRMNGIAALKQIMTKLPEVRIIMLSSLTHEGAKTTFDALEAGAFDYVAKTATSGFEQEIAAKVKDAYRSRPHRLTPTVPPPPASATILKGKKITAVGIGASTGGPIALSEVLSRIPANFPHGIIVAIHMPKAFTGTFAERVNAKCAITVREAVDGDQLKAGVALIAPGGMHVTVVRQGGALTVKLHQISEYSTLVFVPSVDMLITSLAEATSGAMLGVILTGMGSDGFKGMQLVKQKGGITLVQDEATSTIYGMPKACVKGGVADAVVPLPQIGAEITRVGTMYTP